MATYYIDPTAGPGGDGSIGTPFDAWADVTWTAGNSYLQKGGTTAREKVTVGATGTVGNVITLGSYGTGKAIIQPTTSLTSWTQVGATEVYYATLAADPRSVFIGGNYVQPAHWPTTVGANPPVYQYPSSNSADATHLIDTDLNGKTNDELTGSQLYIYTTNYSQRTSGILSWDDITDTLAFATITNIPTTTMRYWLVAKSGTGISYANKAWMMSENSFFYDTDAQRLYVWKTGGGDPGTVEASDQYIGILVTNRDYITIQDLVVRYVRMVDTYDLGYSTRGGIVINTTAAHSNITIQRCDVSYSGYTGISVANSGVSSLLIDNCTVDHTISGIRASTSEGTISNNTVTNTGGIYPVLPSKGFSIEAFEGAGPMLISGNTTTTSGWLGISNSNTGAVITNNVITTIGTHLEDGGGIYIVGGVSGTGIISGNTLTSAGSSIYFDSTSTGWSALNNTVIEGYLGCVLHEAESVTVSGNTFTGPFTKNLNPCAIYIDDESTPSGNIITNNFINSGGDGGIIVVSGAANSGTNIYNNTIVNSDIGIKNIDVSLTLGNVQNNIFYNNTTHVKTYSGAQTTLNYNCYYGTGNWIYGAATETAYSSWKTTSSLDAIGSLNSNPLLSGYLLLPDSPCIRAGLTIESVTNDIDGYKRPGRPGNKYSIGCCEYLGTNDSDRDENCRLPYR